MAAEALVYEYRPMTVSNDDPTVVRVTVPLDEGAK